MPASISMLARLLQTVKLSAPASDERFSERPVSAKAATLMTSNQTNRLNRSRVRQKPCMAARNSSIVTWNVVPISSKKPEANVKVAAKSRAMKHAKPALYNYSRRTLPGFHRCPCGA